MTIHSSAQICGPDSEVKVYRITGSAEIFITVTDGHSSVTLNPVTLRQMADALEAFQAPEAVRAVA